jgi:xanthosine utilization system XapX-like protein
VLQSTVCVTEYCVLQSTVCYRVLCVTEYLQQLQKRLLLPCKLTVVAFNSRNVLFITGVVSGEHKTTDRLAV